MMIDKILTNNTNEFDGQLLEYSIQLNSLNYLKRNEMITEDLYKKVKCVLTQNYKIEVQKDIH